MSTPVWRSHADAPVCCDSQRNVLLGNPGKDIGHVLENVVYLELIRRGYDMYIGEVDDVEVDFVIKDEKGTKCIQVAASVHDENTLARELRPL